jgi:hypothetical protein
MDNIGFIFRARRCFQRTMIFLRYLRLHRESSERGYEYISYRCQRYSIFSIYVYSPCEKTFDAYIALLFHKWYNSKKVLKFSEEGKNIFLNLAKRKMGNLTFLSCVTFEARVLYTPDSDTYSYLDTLDGIDRSVDDCFAFPFLSIVKN